MQKGREITRGKTKIIFASDAPVLSITRTVGEALKLELSPEVLDNFLNGNAQSACWVYADDAQLSFVQDRIVVKIKTHARLGQSVHGTCLGISLAPTSEVSLEPYGEGESIGFRDAQMIKVSDRRELNFLLSPFLSHQVPSSMKVNAAELLRKALEGSTASSGYKVSLDKLKIHSVQIQGDDLVVDADGDISVK